MTDLDLLYSEVEDDLRSTVRDLLADRCPPAAVIAVYDGDRTFVDPLWQALAVDLGLAGLLVPEDRGGAGASAREAAVVLEELGRAAAPVPFLTSAVVATTVLLAAGSEPAAKLTASLAAGERTAALAVPFTAAPFTAVPGAEARGSDAPGSEARGARLTAVDVVGPHTLTGTVTTVAGALEADLLLVPAYRDGHVTLYAVDAAAADRRPVVSFDMTRQLADVHLLDVEATPVLDDPDDPGAAERAIRAGLTAGTALLASEQLGVASWCLDETVKYLRTRRQFGRVVGGFQALKHRLADLYAGVESAAAAARYAAAALASGDPDLAVATSVAAAFCGDLAVVAAEEAVQLHGGIGMTWEYPAHLYLKKAKADQIAFGTPGAHRALLASLVHLPGAPR
ncbi:acyl-CoA dehydrogenase [Frankia sp. R43]|uniref:acyl-CoA dehydrogenase family protein n=1 Tax=Frankia sp. R43 TaxID=269536 RepID=UPI0006CA3566|nr:acyl-CoA dehydrogenase family protein [Frankia sp. R43]KPM52354.1 acyl-CoA dehydrogenase [Frankia sp. R43]